MPKKIPHEEYDAILRVLAGNEDGARIDVIRSGLEFALPDRMLQRRLKHLADGGRITAEGAGKGKRYFPVPAENPATEPGEGQRQASSRAIKLSHEGEAIRRSVARALAERIPVGYCSEFLLSYEPNVTEYIPSGIRDDLESVGKINQAGLPAGTYLRRIMDRLIIDLSWNSSRLEGNTYSLLDTHRLFERGESAEGRAAEETQMILNHKSAIEMLANNASDIGFNRYTICNLHALLSENLLSDPGAGGRVRSHSVGITGTVFHPLDVPQQIEDYLGQVLQKAGAIQNPFEQAFFVMVHIPYLQPFDDVNKRVSRLAANIPMIRHSLCPLSFIDVSEEDYTKATLGMYELNRIEYLRDVFVWAYNRSCARYAAIRQSLGEPDPFRLKYRESISWCVRGAVRDGMDKRGAAEWIRSQSSQETPEGDRERFVEVVETELINLHGGNIARYRLRPSEFEAWSKNWE